MGQTITISGVIGSGKSTVAKMLSKKMGWQYYSTGMAQRKIAEDMGITTLELNALTIQDKSIDERIDAVFKNPPWGDNNCIVDSRLAFHFVPKSFKVCLTVQDTVAGERLFNDTTRSGEKKYQSVLEATESAQKRHQLELNHFQKNYGLDIDNKDNFDLIIDTTHLSAEQVCQVIMAALK